MGDDSFAAVTATGAFAGWAVVKDKGVRDEAGSATTAFVSGTNIFFSWLSGKDVLDSCSKHLPEVGGVMAW